MRVITRCRCIASIASFACKVCALHHLAVVGFYRAGATCESVSQWWASESIASATVRRAQAVNTVCISDDIIFRNLKKFLPSLRSPS